MARNALLSVFNKDGIVEFARSLVAANWQIYASGGTAKALKQANVPVTDVAELIGGGAILGHRVVTLSREVHAALLAQDTPKDRAELESLGIPFIDLVCVDLYPLTDEIADPKSTDESIIEKTDIGGPTMLRSAAKGRRIVIAEAAARRHVLDWLEQGEPDAEQFRRQLAARAEAVVADYCLQSARHLSRGAVDGLVADRVAECKYGENAWQTPAALFAAGSSDPLAPRNFKLQAGTPPSYNNWAELDRQLQTTTHIAAAFDRNGLKVPAIAIGTKHGNPCGAAVSEHASEALRHMVLGDPRAIFGGLVMTNFRIDETLAEELLTYGQPAGRRLLDGVSAPAFTEGATQLLARKGAKCRFLVNPALASLTANSLDASPRYRFMRGGFLRQPNYTNIIHLKDPELTTIGRLAPHQAQDLLLAWAVGSTSNSNTITLVKNGQLLGNGVGQQDRVSCCELAIKRARDAGHDLQGASAYSDSFFPFPDGPEVLANAGITAIWTTSGSVKDADTQALCRRLGVVLYQLPDPAGRGFFAH